MKGEDTESIALLFSLGRCFRICESVKQEECVRGYLLNYENKNINK